MAAGAKRGKMRKPMTRKTKIRKRIFGVTSLILAILVASIPTQSLAEAKPAELRLESTVDAANPQFTLDLQNSDVTEVSSATGSVTGITVKVSDYAGTTAMEGAILDRLNGTDPFDMSSPRQIISNSRPETIYNEYTGVKFYQLEYFDYTGNTPIDKDTWGSSIVSLNLTDLYQLVPFTGNSSSGAAITTEDWNTDADLNLSAKYGSQPLVLTLDSKTGQWELASDVWKPSITDSVFGSLESIRVNGYNEYIAIAYREQVYVDDTRSIVLNGEAHASVQTPKTNNAAQYTVHLSEGSYHGGKIGGGGTSSDTLYDIVKRLRTFDDEDYYGCNLTLSGGTSSSHYGFYDADTLGNKKTFAVSIPLPDTMDHGKGDIFVYKLKHDDNSATDPGGRDAEPVTQFKKVRTTDGNSAIQFETDWFSDIAVVYDTPVAKHTVTANADGTDGIVEIIGGNPSLSSGAANPASKRILAGSNVEIGVETLPPGKRVSYWSVTVNGATQEYTAAGSRRQFTVNDIQNSMDFVCYFKDEDLSRNVRVSNGSAAGSGNPRIGGDGQLQTYTLAWDTATGRYVHPGTIEIFPDPASGYELDYWSINGETVNPGSEAQVYDVYANATATDRLVLSSLADDATVVAYYKESTTPVVTTHVITLESDGNGTVTATESANTASTMSSTTLTVEEGKTVTFTPNANSGYVFMKWEVTPSTGSPYDAYGTGGIYDLGPVNQAYTVKGIFEDSSNLVTVTAIPMAGGEVSFDNSSFYSTQQQKPVTVNSQVPMYARPQSGYEFTGWSVNGTLDAGGTSVGTETTFTPTVSADITYHANFRRIGFTRTISDTRSETLTTYVKPTVTPNSNLMFATSNEILAVTDVTSDTIEQRIFAQNVATPPYETSAFHLDLHHTTDGTTPGARVTEYDPVTQEPITVNALALPKHMATRGTVKLYYLDPADNRAYEVTTASVTTNAANERVVQFTVPMLNTDYAFVHALSAEDLEFTVVPDIVSGGTPSVTPVKPDPLPGDRTLTITQSDAITSAALPKLPSTLEYDMAVAYALRMTNTATGAEANDVGNITVQLPLPPGFDQSLGTITAYLLEDKGTATPVAISPTISPNSGTATVTLANTNLYNDDYVFLFTENYSFLSTDLRTQNKPATDSTASINAPYTLLGHRRVIFRNSSGADILPLIQADATYSTFDHVIPYDISYTDENYIVKPNDEFNTAAVSLTVPEGEMKDLTLLTVLTDASGNKALERISFSRNNNTLTFTTTHFSDYAILYNDPAPQVKIYIRTEGNGSVLYENATVTEVTLPENGSAYLVAMPAEGGNRFVGWFDAAGQQVGNPYTAPAQSFGVTNESRYLTARFEPTGADTSGTTDTGGTSGNTGGTTGGGSVTVSSQTSTGGTATATPGANGAWTLQANPASGYQFDGWYKPDGTLLSAQNPYTYTPSGNETITARFSPTSANNQNNSGGGSVTVNQDTTGGTGTGTTTNQGKNANDMPKTGLFDQFGTYKMLAIILLVLFGVIELLGTVNTKKQRVQIQN